MGETHSASLTGLLIAPPLGSLMLLVFLSHSLASVLSCSPLDHNVRPSLSDSSISFQLVTWHPLKKTDAGTSLTCHQLRLCTSNAGNEGSVPGWGAKNFKKTDAAKTLLGSLHPCFLLDSTFSPVTQSAPASAKPLLQLNSLMPFIPSSHPPKHCPNQSLLVGHWFSHQHANTLLFLLFLKYSPAPPPHPAVSPHFTDRAVVRLPPHHHSAVLPNPIVRFLVLTPLQRQQTQPFLGALFTWFQDPTTPSQLPAL